MHLETFTRKQNWFLTFLQGKYSGTANAEDQNGQQIFCIKIDLDLQ
jgi:hypothetical protein